MVFDAFSFFLQFMHVQNLWLVELCLDKRIYNDLVSSRYWIIYMLPWRGGLMTPLSIFNYITFSNSFFANNIMRKVASFLYNLLFGLRFSKHHAITFAFMGQTVDHSVHARTLCVSLTFSKQWAPCSESKNVGGNRKCNRFGSL